jgi:hypothetical protein
MKPSDMRRILRKRYIRATLATMLAIGGALAIVSFAVGHSGRHGPPPPTGDKLAALRTVAARVAGLNGDPHPSKAIAVPSTRKAAAKLQSGADVDTDQDSYLIVLHGHFVGYVAHVPRGAPLPRGSVLTIVVDASTDLVTDWGISDRTPDTSSLGPETSLGSF